MAPLCIGIVPDANDSHRHSLNQRRKLTRVKSSWIAFWLRWRLRVASKKRLIKKFSEQFNFDKLKHVQAQADDDNGEVCHRKSEIIKIITNYLYQVNFSENKFN